MLSFKVHDDVYKKAHGDYNVPYIIQAWDWLNNIHKSYENDILQIDLSRFPLLLNKKGRIRQDRKRVSDPFWTKDNPYPINSLTSDESIYEFMETNKTHIMIQTRDDITDLLKIKNEDPKNNVILITQYICSKDTLDDVSFQRAVAVCFIIRIKHNKEICISLT